MRIGLLPLARPTFDVAYAEEMLGAMLARLERSGHAFTGPRELLLDAAQARGALRAHCDAGVGRLLVLQVTFTDAAMTVEAAETGLNLSIWAIPEPRLGGRLRLNAFCGLNLASHALSRRGAGFAWAFGTPEEMPEPELAGLLDGTCRAGRRDGRRTGTATGAAVAIRHAIAGRRIGRIGEPPEGFDTCACDPRQIHALAGVVVDEIPLDTLFTLARQVPEADLQPARDRADTELAGTGSVNQTQLARSLRLKPALDRLRAGGGYSAFALRCWPETFTGYGGAACGPVSMMGEDRVPCACEADVYGALSQMILQEVARTPVFLTDLVDMDRRDDSAVVWHCGQAPVSMCAPGFAPEATVHSNRRMPLLYQFPLKPGRVTLMRISQAFDTPRMVLAGAEMLDRPMAFSGTSGVLRFDRPVARVLPALIGGGVEHHLAIAYGDHTRALADVAAALDLPVLELA
ncbi:hypothetical protein [Tropicimonas sp.]|uniref:hypothetical protein n=1 Tax=Tropicimonas sp. TaxID=2067044 RepID=UPI003A842970